MVLFDSSSRIAVFEQILRGVGLREIVARIEGPVAELADQITLEVADGRLIDAVAGEERGLEALTILALAERGDVQVIQRGRTEGPRRESARFPDAIGLLRQAEANAHEVLALLAPLGGVGAVPVVDVDRSRREIANVPEAANVVLALIDDRSTVASILRRSPHDIRLTARILQRLAVGGLVPIDEGRVDREQAVPEPDEAEGDAVEADVARWLERERTPNALLSDSAFTTAFGVGRDDAIARTPLPRHGTKDPIPDRSDRAPEISARVRKTVPLETKRPGPADPTDDDLDAAGVGAGRARGWIGIAAAGGLIGVLAGLAITGTRGGPPPIDAGIVIPMAPTSTVATATTSTVAAPTLVDGRPPIAGPDAPEDVKRAEALLNAGRYREAGELLEQLRGTRPDDIAVWILSGQVEVDVGRLESANSFADRALELDPKSYRAWVLAGSVLQFRGRFTAARSAYERALAIDPRHPMTTEIQSVLDQMDRSQ